MIGQKMWLLETHAKDFGPWTIPIKFAEVWYYSIFQKLSALVSDTKKQCVKQFWFKKKTQLGKYIKNGLVYAYFTTIDVYNKTDLTNHSN